MAWPTPQYSRSRVNRAGKTIARSANGIDDIDEFLDAFEVVNNWRYCHGYPINTFQATLRHKLKAIDSNAIVAQRLKRMPSIIAKLRREHNMQLSRMQDIGGLRGVVGNISQVRKVEDEYKNSQFAHELVRVSDYIKNPKPSGYRGVHMIYKYRNRSRPDYDGLLLELQIRSKIQHAWATAVETMGTFLKQALKASEGPEQWLEFFALAGSGCAHLERTPAVPNHQERSAKETFQAVLDEAKSLDAIDRLQAFSIAAEQIYADRKQGSYHLIVLDFEERTVGIQTYGQRRLDEASAEYARVEKSVAEGAPLQAVLVSAGPIADLRRAYPNYFLDTAEFVQILRRMERHIASSNK